MRKQVLVVSLLLLVAAGAAEASTSAWVWGNNPVASPYAPFAGRAFNPSGGAITITRPGVGLYQIRFAGLLPLANAGAGPLAGNVQVTPLVSGTCTVQNWAPVAPDVLITVQCRNVAGAPTNLQYSVLYTFN